MTDLATIEPSTDPKVLALLRNDLRGLTKAQIGELVEDLTQRMGIDPSMAPIDLITERDGKIRVYFNARAAAEIAKRHELTDVDLTVEIRDLPPVVIAKVTKGDPSGRTLMDVGASSYLPDRPQDLARAIKTATTSAHRRATMRMVGIFINEPTEGTVVDGDA